MNCPRCSQPVVPGQICPSCGTLQPAMPSFAAKPEAAAPPSDLPPGRPYKTVLEMAIEDGAPGRYAIQASAQLKALGYMKGPEEILVMNWILAIPGQPKGLLAHVLLKDRTGFSFKFAAQGPRMPDASLTEDELQASRELIKAGLLRRVVFAGPYPWPQTAIARAAAADAAIQLVQIAV